MLEKFKRHLVTAALPYANGPVHIGHLAGVYIPADIFVRYLRLKKQDVLFICGSDEHGVPITLKARREGITPQEVVDKFHNIIKNSFQDFGISFDIYSRTTSPVHYETSTEIFMNIYEKGIFEEQTSLQLYDTEAKQFLADRYVTGTCPNCKSEGAYGDQCEKCGSSLNANDLINPKSTISGTTPVLKETKHWYLPLNKYEDWLKKWILEDHKEWKTNVYGQCKSWLDQGLQLRAVSRDLDWGVPIPIEGAEGKVLYVWFDAPIGYISATKELTSDWEKYWKSPDSQLVHFIGKDNIVFHCIVFPVVLKAAGSYILPENVPANEFLNLEYDKISTSRNWAVWLHEYLLDFPDMQDVLRYTLTANAPETKDNDFTWKEFQTRNNSELVAVLGNFVNRALVLTQKYFDNKVPQRFELSVFDKEIIAQIGEIKSKVEHSIESYKFREALQNAMQLARIGNKYLADTEPWKLIKTDENRTATILNIALQISANLACVFQPFLPFTAEKIKKMLAQDFPAWEDLGSLDHLSAGHSLGNSSLLFSQIEDKQVELQMEKLNATKSENSHQTTEAKPFKANIQFEDFQKVDMRIGTIREAEKVPKSKNLLKLKIHDGLSDRTIVSGIATFYAPEKLIGKQVVFIANLESRVIKGIESQGMILSAENPDGTIHLINPFEPCEDGSIIC